MAALKEIARDVASEIRDGIGWVIVYRTGRSWHALTVWSDLGNNEWETDDINDALEALRLDPRAVALNGYYLGHFGDMTIEDIAAGIRYHYERGTNALADDDILTQARADIEAARKQAAEAGLPFSERLVDGPEDDTLLNRALLYLNKQGEYKENDLYTPALCHRLDTGTSGLVIIAKTPEAEELFLSAIKNREVQKTYLCVTFGRPMPPDATLGGYLLKDADRGIVKIVEDKQPGAKEVETRYETIAVSGRLALLKVQLITGRTHQIRAHMASIGCPILGDSKYGNNSANRELKLKYQALCAWELTMPRFTQPDFAFLSGKTFHAPKPWYYQQILDGTLK